MATTWGWLLGGLILPELTWVIAGVLVGIFQWLVLQGRVARPWSWIVATGMGWVAGYFITLFALPQELEVLTGMILGLTTGIAQWLILRRELHWAGWWIIFSMIGWITGLTLLPGSLPHRNHGRRLHRDLSRSIAAQSQTQNGCRALFGLKRFNSGGGKFLSA